MNIRDISMQIKGLEDFRNDYVRIAKQMNKNDLGIGGEYIITTIKAMDIRISELVDQRKSLIAKQMEERRNEMKQKLKGLV